MALDLGERRIGIAISDESRRFARSLATIKRRSRVEDYRKIGQIVAENEVNLVIVGLPLSLSGRTGKSAIWARDYGTSLGSHLGVRVVFWDESFSTIDAEASLRERGISGRKRRKQVDATAAAFILQNYLDSSTREENQHGNGN